MNCSRVCHTQAQIFAAFLFKDIILVSLVGTLELGLQGKKGRFEVTFDSVGDEVSGVFESHRHG